jgi:thiol:disulfide interchange protein DsbD
MPFFFAAQTTDPRGSEPAKRRFGRGAILLVVVLVAGWIGFQWLAGSLAGAEQSLVTWRGDYAAALAQAKRQGRPVLLEFTADWCPPCQWMDANVYSQQRVADRIARQFVAVQVDLSNPGPAQQRLADQWQVRGVPAMLLLSPEGEPIARHVGRMRADAMLRWFEQAPSPAATQPDASP